METEPIQPNNQPEDLKPDEIPQVPYGDTLKKKSFSRLSDISHNLGYITAGNITFPTTGWIKGGQTGYNTGTGFFLGYSTDNYKFSIGDGTEDNSLLWDGTDLKVKGQTFSYAPFFGDGSDGDVTISADTSLSRDMYYNNLTVSTGYTLNPNGYRIFVKGTLTIQSGAKISRSGNDGTAGGAGTDAPDYSNAGVGGSAGVGGAALSDGSIKGAVAGQDGVAGVDGVTAGNSSDIQGNYGNYANNGVDVDKSLTGDGVAGGKGGDGGAISGGVAAALGRSGGTAGVKTGTVYNYPRIASSAYLLYDFLPSGESLKSSAGSGSGGGAASGNAYSPSSQKVATGGSGGSGGSGSPGGIVVIFAYKIINDGEILAEGGKGGDGGDGGKGALLSGSDDGGAGGSGGGGGGAGGSGGVIILVYNQLTNSGTISAAGGIGGKGGKAGVTVLGGSSTEATAPQDGADGANGNNGVVIQLQN